MATVFLSYRRGDGQAAQRLAEALRQAHHDVWLDIWAIRLGDSIVERINDGLAGAVYVVVCYSSAPSTSPWMDREWQATLARQLNGAGVKLLPVRLTGGVPPAILEDIKYADLVKDWNQGLSELLDALRTTL